MDCCWFFAKGAKECLTFGTSTTQLPPFCLLLNLTVNTRNAHLLFLCSGCFNPNLTPTTKRFVFLREKKSVILNFDCFTHLHCYSGFLRPGAPSEQNRPQSSPDNEEETEVLPEEIPLLPKLLQNMLRSNPSQSSQSPQNLLLLSQNPPHSHCASEITATQEIPPVVNIFQY